MTVLQTHNLAAGYIMSRRRNLVIARDLNLSLFAGEMICLLGPNGAGKSTLMRTLAGMQKPLAGRIIVSGEDIQALKPRQRAKRLSVVLTDRPGVGLLSGYALVALGRHPYTDWTGRLSRYDEAIVQWAIDAVDARELADRPVMELSDGQQQKFMIARALAQESDIILLDEPTAFLDLPRRAEMMRLLKHLAAETGRAILLSTHDLDLALRSADTLWLMSDGQIRTGTPEDLVINGSFEEAFQSDGVSFDRSTGAFSVEPEPGEIVIVQGHGIAHTWTHRALRRAGFTVQSDDMSLSTNGTGPPPKITLTGGDSQPEWHLHWHGHETTCHSIRDLLTTIRQRYSDNDIKKV